MPVASASLCLRLHRFVSASQAGGLIPDAFKDATAGAKYHEQEDALGVPSTMNKKEHSSPVDPSSHDDNRKPASSVLVL